MTLKEEDLTIAKKTKLLCVRMSTLLIWKEFCRDHRTVKKDVKKYKLKIQSKGKGFKNLLPRGERKLK